MIKITETTEFDFYHSLLAEMELGNGSYINVKGVVKPYSERILKGKQPHLATKYPDLKKVFTGNSKQYTLEFKHGKA